MMVIRTMGNHSPKITQEDAIGIAAQFLGKNSISKSTSNVRCDVVTRPKCSISKSGLSETDTMMYVLNYGNDEGYAVVCADIRVPDQVFAFSETGSMNMENDNPGIKLFMDMAQDYMDINIAKLEGKRDSLEQVLNEKFAELSDYKDTHLSKSRTMISMDSYDYYHDYKIVLTEKVNPMLRTFWDQIVPIITMYLFAKLILAPKNMSISVWQDVWLLQQVS